MAKDFSFSVRSLLDREKLKNDGMNFMDWHRSLKIVLRHKKKEYILTNPLPDESDDKADQNKKDMYVKHMNYEHDVSCLLVSMTGPELQKRFETNSSY